MVPISYEHVFVGYQRHDLLDDFNVAHRPHSMHNTQVVGGLEAMDTSDLAFQ